MGLRRSEVSIEEVSTLVRVSDYRNFIKSYLQMKNLNYSDFSRAAHCTRAFTNQVLSHKRRLTNRSAYAFEQAFKLPSNAKKIFRLLVAREESDLFPEIDRNQLENQIKKLQLSIENKTRKECLGSDFDSKTDNDFDLSHQAMSIFAACGDHSTGATYEQIYQRTRFAENVLDKNIAALMKIKLLEKKEDRYFPLNLHVFLQTRTQSELLFSVFKMATHAAGFRLNHVPEDSNEFFFASQICINESQLPALKNELKESILKFVDESIVGNGDRVVKILTAMHL